MELVGFVFDGESNVLCNLKDLYDIKVFDKLICGYID